MGTDRRRLPPDCRRRPFWRGDQDSTQTYEDVAGFCKAATLDEIRQHGHILTPGRYVGAAEVKDDGEPFEEKMARLVAQWVTQIEQAQRLDAAIAQNLEALGYVF